MLEEIKEFLEQYIDQEKDNIDDSEIGYSAEELFNYKKSEAYYLGMLEGSLNAAIEILEKIERLMKGRFE